jgi:peptidase S24-like protein
MSEPDPRVKTHPLVSGHTDWVIDDLIGLVARVEMRRPQSSFYVDHRFIASMAADMRARADMADVDEDQELDAIASHLYERVLGRLLDDRVAGPQPNERSATVAGPVGTAIAEARIARCAPRYDLSIAAGLGRELWDEPCISWIELPPQVPIGDYIALTVRGESMEPLIHSGDVVLVKLGRELLVNTLVVARASDDGYVIKRVGRVLGSRVELNSLNPDFAPLSIPNDTSRVLGTVVLRWCDHGRQEERSGKSD